MCERHGVRSELRDAARLRYRINQSLLPPKGIAPRILDFAQHADRLGGAFHHVDGDVRIAEYLRIAQPRLDRLPRLRRRQPRGVYLSAYNEFDISIVGDARLLRKLRRVEDRDLQQIAGSDSHRRSSGGRLRNTETVEYQEQQYREEPAMRSHLMNHSALHQG